jgi:hypothetical protein
MDGEELTPEHYVRNPRLTIGALGTGAIRLARASGEPGIAQGFEKALSATQLTGVPCWSRSALPASTRLHYRRACIPFTSSQITATRVAKQQRAEAGIPRRGP